MAKIYGHRWETIRSLKSGGQADVFVVRDVKGEHTEQLALKRVRNPKRHDRFRAEVEAIKRLDHPNIIKLIDHSALSAENLSQEKQFLVMPLAENGDLEGRVGFYKGNLDGALQVAKSIASALKAAHAAGVVHRDVKPQNILFPEQSHEVWLADFGICLIRDLDRTTLEDEVVGPVQFMAPELESGGHLDVSPAADVYSLGKVIYFMISGGIVLPRERLNEAAYAAVFMEGERHRLLQRLLSRMICPIERRLTSMAEVTAEIERIQSWERNASLLPIDASTLAQIEGMKQKALEVKQQTDLNADIRARRYAALENTYDGAIDWFAAELEKFAAHFSERDLILTGVRRIDGNKNDMRSLDRFRPGPGVEVWIENKSESFRREHVLRLSIGTAGGMVVTTEIINGSVSSIRTPRKEEEHTKVLVVPSYGRRAAGQTGNLLEWLLFRTDGELHQVDNHFQTRPSASRLGGQRPAQPVKIMALQFSTDDWPEAAEHFPELLKKSLQSFVTAMSTARL